MVEGNLGMVSSMDEALTFVQSLAEKVVGHDVPLSDTETKAVHTIEAYVKRMLEDIKKQRNQDQAEVNRYRAVVKGCADSAKESLDDSVNNLRAESNKARGIHVKCRRGEADEATETSTQCSKYDAYRSSPPGNTPPKCMETLSSSDVTTTDAATKKSMEQCITAINAWVVPLYDLYMKCKKKRDDHIADTRSCDVKQATFESDFCQYATLLAGTCEGQTKCRKTSVGILKVGDGEVKVAEKARQADCEVGHKVDCLLQIFEETDNSKKPKMLEHCKKLVPTCPDKIEYPPIPGPTPCSEEPNEPCAKAWLEKEYTNQKWYALAPTTWCHACSPPHPCKVTLYQSKHFEGWQASFPPGDWPTRALRRGGARDDQVSAIEVEEGCLAVVYKNPDLTGLDGVFAPGKYDYSEFHKVFPNDLVSSLLVLRKLSFETRGRHGEEEIIVKVGELSEKTRLTESWQQFEFDVPSDGQFTIEFLNAGGKIYNGGDNDVFFRSQYHAHIKPPDYWNRIWKCDQSVPTDAGRCKAVEDGELAWNGKYVITLG